MLAAFTFLVLLLIIIWWFLEAYDAVRITGLPTTKAAIEEVAKIITAEQGDFFDLGSGSGRVANFIARKFPKLSVRGYEKDPIRVILSRIRGFFLRSRASFRRGDFRKSDISRARIIYSYLPWELMPDLEKKFMEEAPQGAIFITNTTSLPNLKPLKTVTVHLENPAFERLFVYRKL